MIHVFADIHAVPFCTQSRICYQEVCVRGSRLWSKNDGGAVDSKADTHRKVLRQPFILEGVLKPLGVGSSQPKAMFGGEGYIAAHALHLDHTAVNFLPSHT